MDIVRMGAVYVLIAGDGVRNFIKIGTTKEGIKKRVSKLQTGCPYKIYPCMRLEAPADKILKIEKDIHRILEKHRSHGEWFRYNLESRSELLFRLCLAAWENQYTLFEFGETSKGFDFDEDGSIVNVGYRLNMIYGKNFKKVKGIKYSDIERTEQQREFHINNTKGIPMKYAHYYR